MSWIATVPPGEAAGELGRIYDAIKTRASSGQVGRFWQSLSLDPGGLGALLAFQRALMDDPRPLTTAQAEMIAVVVSATNGCAYCVSHHGPRLAQTLGDEALARALARDYREANLAARDRVLLDYAVALTCEPAERTQADVERMREYGFEDGAVLRATEIAAQFNFVNRVACALGVTLEPGREAWEFGSQR